MKKYFFVLLIALLSCESYGQGATADSLVLLYKRYLELSKGTSDSLSALYNQFRSMRQEVNVNTELANKIDRENLLNAKTRYEKNVESIRRTVVLMESAMKSIKALEASLSATDYFNSISALNNPTNDELGFKLEDDIIKLLEDKILSKVKKKRGDRLRMIISSIFNSPITSTLLSAVPAVNTLTSVVNMVNVAAVDEDKVEAADLRAFQAELRKYIEHYEALARINQDFSATISSLNVKADGLEKLATDFIRVNAHDLYQKELPANYEKMPATELIRDYYNYMKVDDFIRGIENDTRTANRIAYEKLVTDSRLGYSVVGRQKVAFMGEQLEQLTNEYLTSFDSYHKNIVKVLEKSTLVGGNQAKIKQKVENLNKQFDNLKTRFIENIDLATTKKRLYEIPRY